MKHSELAEKRLTALTAIGAAGLAAVCGVSGFLMAEAMNRREPKRIILAVHGWRSFWWRDFGPIADFWAQNGCSVLYIEQRAQGESEGDYIGFGMLERFDCLDWLQWLNENGGKDLPIYLAGISMGATTVLMTADQALPKNVCGIMADCGFTSPASIWHKVKEENLHLHNPAMDTLILQENTRFSPWTPRCCETLWMQDTSVVHIEKKMVQPSRELHHSL